MKIVIREAEPEDAVILAKNNVAMALETEGKALDPDVIGPGVRAVLGDAHKGRYWVAESAGTIIGQIMVTYEWSDWRNGTIWWIQSVYVHPEHRRRGIFSALYRHVEALAHDNNACGLRLYVEDSNERAQKTYQSLGMVIPNYQVMETIFGDTKC